MGIIKNKARMRRQLLAETTAGLALFDPATVSATTTKVGKPIKQKRVERRPSLINGVRGVLGAGGAPAVTLGTITLSGALTQGTAAIGVSIFGATDGSTITFNISGLSVGTAGTTRSVTGVPATSGALTYTETLAGAVGSPAAGSLGAVAAAADTTAPALSNPTDAVNGSTGGTLGVSTDEGNGTLYWFVSASATPPTAANLKDGTGAVSSGSQTVTATGAQSASATGLTASTAYYAHFLHRDAAGNDSAIVSGDGFTTANPPAAGAAMTMMDDTTPWLLMDAATPLEMMS